ncbi:MAG: DUF2141 domain-containing protein [bacterium]
MRLAVLLLLFAFLSAPEVCPAEEVGSIKVIITGFKNDHGQARIGLTTAREYDASEEENFKGAAVKISSGRAEWTFSGVPYGEYGVRVYHDENMNDKLDRSFFGMPAEAYGLSNNARGRFKAPSFDAVKFKLDSDNITIQIEVK